MLQQLMALFDDCFFSTLNTRLVRGDDEPIYLPADSSCEFNRIVFAHGFVTSALHEISHWCIAGDERRKLIDYGYWYNADGRTAEQQKTFETVEVKPQAIEWMLSLAAGIKFRISVDNLEGDYTDPMPFKRAVLLQVQSYCARGLPERAQLFHDNIARSFSPDYLLDAAHFQLADL